MMSVSLITTLTITKLAMTPVIKQELPHTPVEKVTKELANLHVQGGLSAALDLYDNGYFEIMPVRTF